MKAGKKRKKKSIFLRIALLAFSVYVIVMLVQLQLEIGQRQQQIDSYAAAIEKQKKLNEDIQEKSDNYEKYLEQQARDQNMVRPGEIIIQEIPDE